MHDTPVRSEDFVQSLCDDFLKYNKIDPAHYEKWDVKRGLRNADGTGVMAGITRIGNVQGYYLLDGEKTAMPGKLIYRGIDMEDLIGGFVADNRFGFEETTYLLMFGTLPTRAQLNRFCDLMDNLHTLPPNFTEDMILKAPSPDVMNKLARSVLALYSYDDAPEPTSLPDEMYKALQLIARVPTIVAHAFSVKRHYYDNESLHLHRPGENLSVAQNFLRSIRPDGNCTDDEAKLLDLCLIMHMEHGGGNNSAFACQVLSSSGTDIYSSISAAVGSLKGPKHGGANIKVMEMFDHIERNVKDWTDEDELRAYLDKILAREAGDGSGLIYGMGHAVYTVSDPRAILLRKFARKVAAERNMLPELELFERVEQLAPAAFAATRTDSKSVCSNVDFYSGLVYKMMGIPPELFTPLFAIARMVGWCAHRIEELYTPGGRIIRPAYKAVAPAGTFVPLDQRG